MTIIEATAKVTLPNIVGTNLVEMVEGTKENTEDEDLHSMHCIRGKCKYTVTEKIVNLD